MARQFLSIARWKDVSMHSNLMLAMGAAATLAIPGGYWLGNLLLGGCGLLRWKGLRLLFGDAGDFRWFLFACVAFVAGNGVLLAYHGEPASAYEYLIPFLITPILLNGLRRQAVSPHFLFAGFALAALAAGLLAIEQVLVSGDHGRAIGHIKPIAFGNLSIVAATVSLMGLTYQPKKSSFSLRMLLVSGLSFGLVASLLSGSKGGWLAVLVVGPVLLYPVYRTLDRRTAIIISPMLVAGLGFAMAVPQSPVPNRLYQVVSFMYASDAEDRMNDGSLSPRLSMWRYVLADGVWRSPFIGSSRAALFEQQKKAIEEGSAPGLERAWSHFHNELLDTLITKGLAGAALLALLFFSAFCFFIRRVRDIAPGQRALGWLGVIVLLEFAVFSLTDILFQVNAVRSVFVFVIVSLASLILAGEQGSAAPASSDSQDAA